ncbi:hypothetical protein [Caldivirga sp. UBA161]|uniref:hypothetical protein n=1 Tax=Caldivirga sp. UBA161 TaxID=1915569 RepID=UPI0025BBAFD7|nr:hypothetical protein [Caldivirga sp. UBA161]
MGSVGMRILKAIVILAVAATIVSLVSLVVMAQNPQFNNGPQPMPNALGGLIINIINANGSIVGLISFNGQFTWGGIAVQLINPKTEYVVAAYDFNFTEYGPIEYIGYTYVNGSTLLSVIKGNLSKLYSWIREEIILKPLSQYPKSSATVIVKSPSGELISNGTLCAIPVSAVVTPWFRETSLAQGVICVEVINGVARLNNLSEVPYYLLYRNFIKLGGSSISTVNVTHKVVNVYGVGINATEYIKVVSVIVPSIVVLGNLTFMIPSNSTLTMIAEVLYPPLSSYSGSNGEGTTVVNESDPVSMVNSMNGAFSILPLSTSTSESASSASVTQYTTTTVTIIQRGYLERAHYELALVAVIIAVVTGFIAALVASRIIVKSGDRHE